MHDFNKLVLIVTEEKQFAKYGTSYEHCLLDFIPYQNWKIKSLVLKVYTCLAGASVIFGEITHLLQ